MFVWTNINVGKVRTLGIDVTQQVMRKIDIVDHRPTPADSPKR